MSASLDGVGSQTDISSLLILPRLSFLYLKFEYFMTHFCMCVLNREEINSNLWNFELLLSVITEKGKTSDSEKKRKKSGEFRDSIERERNGEAVFLLVALLFTRGKGLVCLWSEMVMSTIMAELLWN